MHIRNHLRRFSFNILPGTCVLCADPTYRDVDLCIACERELPYIENACARCGLPIRIGGTCLSCVMNPPKISSCFAPLAYATPVDRLISRFKTSGEVLMGRVLAEVVANRYARRVRNLPDVLVPVPLHRRRRRKRGFNQAEEIAAVLASRCEISLDSTLCQRRINTPEQKSLAAASRRRNLRGVFTARRTLAGESVAIVDDVITTGATVAELATVLAKAGAGTIEVIALARTAPR